MKQFRIRSLLSFKRLSLDDQEGKVCYQCDKSQPKEEHMDYLEFIARVTSHIPDKGQVMIRYYGLYSNALRGKIRKAGVSPSLPPIIEEESLFVPSKGLFLCFIVDLIFFPVICSFQDVRGWKSDKIVRYLPQAQKANFREIVESFKPDYPFTHFFLDDSFNEMYQEEQKLGTLFGNFSTLAIFISCLGLFGLASFAVETRTKEVGIRKVLGASVSSIMMLISKGLARCVFFANIIDWPVAYFVAHKWLQNFAYRVNLGMWIFILSGLASLAIALLTISYQTVKAALADPVDSLRYE